MASRMRLEGGTRRLRHVGGGNDQIIGQKHSVSIDESHIELTVHRRYDASSTAQAPLRDEVISPDRKADALEPRV